MGENQAVGIAMSGTDEYLDYIQERGHYFSAKCFQLERLVDDVRFNHRSSFLQLNGEGEPGAGQERENLAQLIEGAGERIQEFRSDWELHGSCDPDAMEELENQLQRVQKTQNL